VVAAGINFKDVAITMGIVPDDEHNIGLECGFVKRLGPGVTKSEVGDRVCMSFEEAATIPSVYL